MSDDGTSFEIDLPVTGKELVDAAAASMDVLVARQTAASKAMLAASDAVKAAEAAYQTAEKSADSASKAVEKLGLAAESQWKKFEKAQAAGDSKAAERASAAIKALAERQDEAKAKADALHASLLKEAAALDAAKGKAALLAEASSKLKDAIDTKAKNDADPAYEKIARGLGKLGGPLATVGEKVARVGSGFTKLREAFGGSAGAIVGTTVLVAALVAGFVALAVSAVVTTAKIATWMVGLADANRQASLLAQGMVQSVKGGEALNAEIKAISKTLPISNDELATMAKGFAYAGYRGKDLENALRGSATWAARLKFGPDFAKEMLSLEQQSKVFQANIASTFGSLKIEGLLTGLQRLIALFDTTTESGKAIQVIMESLFQPLIDNVAGAQYKVERFFLQLEVWALEALIAIKPYYSTIVTIVEALAIGAAVIVGTVVVAFALLAAAVGLVALALAGVFELSKFLTEAWIQLGEDIGDLVFQFVDMVKKVGPAIIEGLIQGIENGGAAVLAALKGVVLGAVNGVKGLLGIHSPSTVFAEIGTNTGEGMALGVERSAPRVADSLENMVEPPASSSIGAPAAPASSPSTASGPGARGSVSLDHVSFVFHGVQGAEEAEGRFRELLTRVLEGDVAHLGAAHA